jgi:hypothetical protein
MESLKIMVSENPNTGGNVTITGTVAADTIVFTSEDAKPKGLYSSISMDSITRAAAIHRWGAKAPWPLNERLHK